MSTYRHFLTDFPTRCTQLLKLMPEDKSLDVTLLLAVAGQAIIIPLERLGVLRGEKHLFREDQQYPRAREQLKAICKRECGDSPLFQPADLNVWRYSHQLPSQLIDGSLSGADTKSIKGEQCWTILQILRAAFAHGNLITRNNPITSLFFLSKVRDQKTADCLQCDVSTFRNFVNAWAREIKQLDLESDEAIAG